MNRYAEELNAALPAAAPSHWRIAMPVPPGPWPVPRGMILARMIRHPRWARRQPAALYHILDHSCGHLLLTLPPSKTAVTVHDLAPFRFPGRRAGLSGLAWHLAWRGLQRARHLIANSAFTSSELRQRLSDPPAEIPVVPMAVSSRFHEQPGSQRGDLRHRLVTGGEHLLLHVGAHQPRKNLPVLLRAAALLRQQGLPVRLAQIGGQPALALRQLITGLGLASAVTFPGRITDDELADYYRAADVFVFPSLYEGFGIPVLEAMACGTPVVAARAASLPEVAGPAARLVDPESPVELALTLKEVLTRPELSRQMAADGLRRARQFTWEAVARQTVAVYHQILEGSQP